MFNLVNGEPVFYVGKINGIGYTSEEEKEALTKRLIEDNPDVGIIDEEVEIDKDLKIKVEELAKLKLTYSKSEFMQYLTGEKPLVFLELQELQETIDILLGGEEFD